MSKRSLLFLPLFLTLVLVLGLPAGAADNPCNPCGKNPCNPCGKNPCNPCGKNPCNPCGKAAAAPMPAINPCFAKAGTVFYVNDPMKRNSVTFTSEAPLEDIVGTTNEIKGYVVFDPENPKDGVKGEFVVPVAALDTGIPLRDEHLRSPMWLDAKSYPHIKLVVKDAASRVRNVKSTEDFETYEATLDTEVTLHGVSRTMDIPARMVYMPESEKTKQKMPGDLLAGRSTFEVPLDLFGITGPAGQDLIGTRVGETVEIEVSFTGTTSKQAGNPCNPCGKNPCNPCGKNPCNPCGKNPCNPCGKNPCNPCGKNPCNPCGK